MRWRQDGSGTRKALPMLLVAEYDSEEDVMWAKLKRMERSIEKVCSAGS